MLQLIRDVLAAEQPDLVILGGDQVSGYDFPAANLAARLSLRLDGSSLTGSWYERQWARLIQPLHEAGTGAGVPYASILGALLFSCLVLSHHLGAGSTLAFPPLILAPSSQPLLPPLAGNHDGEADLSRREIVELDVATGRGLSLTRLGNASLAGAGNYWLDVAGPEEGGTQPVARIWMLDSGNRGCGNVAWGW